MAAHYLKKYLFLLFTAFVFFSLSIAAYGDVIIDDGDTGTSYTGTWLPSGGTDPYNSDSLWARNGAKYMWQMSGQVAGTYEVYMWWSGFDSRATNVAVNVTHRDGTSTVYVNQLQNAGQWNLLGQYYFVSDGTVTITAAAGSTISTCADAVKFTLVSPGNIPPVASIDSIAPNPASVGEAIQFEGSGSDADGTVAAYSWRSNIDGPLSTSTSFSRSDLSEGSHTIFFKVQDNSGDWSPEVSTGLVIGPPPDAVTIDNRDSSTSSTGAWPVSGAPDPYSSDSVWARDGATFTWRFTPAQTGSYDVAMWWTVWDSRGASIPVDIQYAGSTARVFINQQQNGKQWNLLGRYQFIQGTEYAITITAPPKPTSTCADAVRFFFVPGENLPPTASIDSIAPNPAFAGELVTFTGSGADADGIVTAYSWRSSIDGELSTSASFGTEDLSEGNHTVFLKVQDNMGEWSPEVSSELAVGPASSLLIIDNTSPSTSWTGTWPVSGAPDPYGSNSVWSRDGATFTWRFTPGQTGSYDISMWWTVWDSRGTSIPVDIQYEGGTDRVFVNQKVNGKQWNLLGKYQFVQGVEYRITIISQASPSSTCADAVKLTFSSQGNIPPVASIDSIAPNPAQTGELVQFAGSGTDNDGTITAYSWRSSIDGELSTSASFVTSDLSEGNHTIFFKVQDNFGEWSPEVSTGLIVTAVSGAITIDNRDSATSRTGSWYPSGAPDPYATDSVWSRDGATFTWRFTPGQTGSYDVSMWWTVWASRSESVSVDIHHAGETTRVFVNQRLNGKQWNPLGRYEFIQGTTYGITVTAQPGPSSTCADAVRFEYMPGGGEIPVAVIDSISPDPAHLKQMVTMSGRGTDSDGTIRRYSWRSDIDGQLSSSASFSTKDLSKGRHTIYFKVMDNVGNWSPESITTLDLQEHIYIVYSYTYYPNARTDMESLLTSMGAVKEGEVLRYQDANQATTLIYSIGSVESMRQAMQTEGAHVIINGHSNFGLGAIFATPAEQASLTLNDIRYIDDDRIFGYATPDMAMNLDYFRVNQALPFWWPIYKDGTSGLMPYDFSDPNEPPAYNYRLTYQLPGDPAYYPIESLRRYPDSGKPAWFSSSGDFPDASNPLHQQYYITNSESWTPTTEKTGEWTESKGISGYWKENYHYSTSGSGSDIFSWFFDIDGTGTYKISAWWTPSSLRATNAPFTIEHDGGSTVVEVNQQINGRSWFDLGNFTYSPGRYTVSLSDNADGNVVADAIRVAHIDNPAEFVQANFVGEHRIGPAPLIVNFKDQSTGDITSRRWEMGDGYITTDFVRTSNFHYTYDNPGTYTVKLTVGGPIGTNSVTKAGYVIVTDSTSTPASSDFEVQPTRTGNVPFTVSFANRSMGDIVSYNWDFGDGTTGTSSWPSHTYTTPGIYPVSLTVTDSLGNQVTETKENFIRAVQYERIVDNMTYPKVHYGYKIILAGKEPQITREELKYERIFYDACTSGVYYLQTIGRGLAFYTTTTAAVDGMFIYLKAYLEGKSNEEIWGLLQDYTPIFSYYDFSKYPSEQ